MFLEVSALTSLAASVNTSVVGIKVATQELSGGLDNVSTSLAALYAQCQTDGHAFCGSLPQSGPSPQINTSQVARLLCIF